MGFYDDEETSNAIDEQLAEENEEFAGVLATYAGARGALAKARIARGFYLVVVPREADTGYRPRFGRAITVKPEGGKGKTKDRGKKVNDPEDRPDQEPRRDLMQSHRRPHDHHGDDLTGLKE